MSDIQFDHYSHRVDHDNSVVVELAITLLVEENSPEQSEFVQAFADGVMKLLRELRENFPREKFDYYGTRFDEWLVGVPAMEPYLSSYDIPELPPSDEGELLELSREKITQKEADDPVTVKEWFDFVLEEQETEDEEFSREKSEGCDDPFDLEDTLLMKPVLGVTEESREDVIVEGIESKNLRINEGVAPHVITRKYYPDPRCKTQCTMINTDYCRLVCDDELLQGLGDISPIDITIFVEEVDEDFSHEK